MRCPSCGAVNKKRSMKCQDCGAFRNKHTAPISQKTQVVEANMSAEAPPIEKAKRNGGPKLEVQTTPVSISETTPPAAPAIEEAPIKPSPSLIEFPGMKKTPVPEWRKELGERVREVQERRAREATVEGDESPTLEIETEIKASGLLELLPQAQSTPMNPLVVAALRRIERAHSSAQYGSNVAVATVADYQDQPEMAILLTGPGDDGGSGHEPPSTKSSNGSEKTHNLAVVPSPVLSQPVLGEASSEEKISGAPRRKPNRLIVGDLNDPALNYLDKIPTTVGLTIRHGHPAPIFRRLLSGILDLIVVCLLSAPFVALVKLTQLDWQDVRVITYAAGTLIVIGFLYFTITTALTGRTFGMRVFSLRVVDARTGLIPTGTQSAGRALFFMLSLASAGVALIYTFSNSERHTAHDRFTHTAVVRV